LETFSMQHTFLILHYSSYSRTLTSSRSCFLLLITVIMNVHWLFFHSFQSIQHFARAYCRLITRSFSFSRNLILT
jgi:hypothetical protein